MSVLRRLCSWFCPLAGDMTVSRTYTIKSEHLTATASRFGLRTEVEFDRFPSVAALRLQSQRRRRFVAAMHHAILTAAIACNAIHHAVSVPLGLLEQLCIARVMPV